MQEERSTKRARKGSSESCLEVLSDPVNNGVKRSPEVKENAIEKARKSVCQLLEALGEDPSREGLVDTPKRAANAFLFWTKGYEECLVREADLADTSCCY